MKSPLTPHVYLTYIPGHADGVGVGMDTVCDQAVVGAALTIAQHANQSRVSDGVAGEDQVSCRGRAIDIGKLVNTPVPHSLVHIHTLSFPVETRTPCVIYKLGNKSKTSTYEEQQGAKQRIPVVEALHGVKHVCDHTGPSVKPFLRLFHVGV